MDSTLSLLGNRIRNLREDHDLTQKELSAKLGLTPKMISFYENNQRTPPIDVLLKLSNIFNVSIDYLVGVPNNKELTLSPKEINLLNYFKHTSNQDFNADEKWGPINKYFPNAVLLSLEERELLDYYKTLSQRDKRWIMGQIIDLIKKADEQDFTNLKAQ